MHKTASNSFYYFLYTVFIVFCVLSSSPLCAQSVNETLEAFDKSQDVSTANLFFLQLDKEEFIDERMQFTESTPLDSIRQQVWYWAAEWFYDHQQYDRAETYGLKALPLCHYPNDDKAGNLNILGLTYVRKGDFTHAADYVKRCLDIDMLTGDDDRISASMNSLAGIYMAANQLKEAEDYILKAIQHAEKAGNPARMAVIKGMASDIYHAQGKDSLALPLIEEACLLENQLSQNASRENMRLTQKATVLLGLHQYAETEKIMRMVVDSSRKIGDTHTLSIALNKLGMALLCQQRQQEAIPCYREAADLCAQMGDLYNEIHAHRGLYESYWVLNPDSAKIELDRFDLLKDSLYTHSTAENLARFNAEFSNDELKLENEQIRASHHRSMVMWTILLCLVLLAVWLLVVIMRKRQQRRIEELVEEIRILRNQSVKENRKSELGSSSSAHQVRQPAEKTETIKPDAEKNHFLEQVVVFVNDGMKSGNFGVEQIAGKMNMSVQTFRRRLQEAAGVSPKTFISAIQMENAVTLLTEQSDISVSEVAERCGFSETSSFGHTFKRIYGVSPTQYREQRN